MREFDTMTTTKEAFSASTIHAKKLLWFYATMWTWGFQEGGYLRPFARNSASCEATVFLAFSVTPANKLFKGWILPTFLFSYGGENHYHFLSLFHTQRDPSLMIRHMLVVGGCGRG